MNLLEDLPPQKKTTNMRLFIEVSCTVTQDWKQSKNPITEDLLNQKWYIHTMEYLAAVKRKKKKRGRALHRGTKWIPCVESSLHMDTWTSPNGQHWNQTDYVLCSQRWRSSIQLAKTRPGADCGSDHELLIAKFRLKLKKVGKTTGPFRYDLNQILTIIQWKWEIDLRD